MLLSAETWDVTRAVLEVDNAGLGKRPWLGAVGQLDCAPFLSKQLDYRKTCC